MINCLYSVGGFTVPVLVNDKCQAKNDTADPIIFKLKSKILKFKILQRIIIMFPAILWIRQNVILFHETISLSFIEKDCMGQVNYMKNVQY
jgi:hypothetical protein